VVKLDLRGQVVTFQRDQMERARACAAAGAAASSSRRDLALVLDWALSSSRIVALRRSEAREFERLTREDPTLADLADLLDVSLVDAA
jgi:hypothetical protein